MIPALALAATLLAGARADEPQEVGHPAPPLALDSTLSIPQSWGVVEQGFPHVFTAYLKDIEGAPANRYFPRTLVWVLPGVDAQNHFLDVRCGTLERNRRCAAQSVDLERRVLAVSLLRVLPTGRRPDELFDESRFVLTPDGVDAFRAAQKHFPDLWSRLYGMAAKAIGKRRAAAHNVIESSQ